MSRSEWEIRAICLERLHEAEQRYREAIAQTRRVQSEFDSMSPSDADLALERAIKLQNEAIDRYARIFDIFTRLVIDVEHTDPTVMTGRQQNLMEHIESARAALKEAKDSLARNAILDELDAATSELMGLILDGADDK